jgi:uncharacterized protein (DUF2235 family)
MNKRWVICADGTWNNPEQTDQGKPRPTNVVKLAAAVLPFDDKEIPQAIFYHAGVGEYEDTWTHLTGGAFGAGLSRNIRDLYLFLTLNYSSGDELFLFGFSRGAYTVRSLAGLIRNSGILKDKYVTRFEEAYTLYRDRTDDTRPSATQSIQFRKKYSWPDFNIKFIGVWETVGALGIPIFIPNLKQLAFHDVQLSSHVDYAYQALAIDEKRKPFTPTLWIKQPTSPDSQVLEQAWFPGVHDNIGGGYEDTGLSDCTFDWIWNKAASCGLKMDATQKPTPKANGILYDSMTWFYQLFGDGTRSLGTKLPASNEYLSQTVRDRQCLTDYHPKNVLEFLKKNPQSVLVPA